MYFKVLFTAFFAIVFMFCLEVVECEDGDTGHFQVHNQQEGELKIHATKEIAQIETQANSVQVVLEPGEVNAVEIPKSNGKQNRKGHIHKLIRVDPVNFGGLKKSKIGKARKDKKHHNTEKTKRALIEGKKTFANSIMLAKWKKEHEQYINVNVKRIHKIKRRSVAKMRVYKKETMKNKKSEIEREMRVHGRTGGFHVMTGKRGTKLISKGGALNVFMRNPDRPDGKSNDDNSEKRSPNGILAYHLINSSMNGLSLRKDNISKRELRCAIPPCSP